MDNPLVQDVELAYLAALIDGEGTITLERSGKRRLCGVMGLTPMVLVPNTNEAIIQHTVGILTRLNVNPYVKSQPAGKAKRNKICYWVCVKGLAKTTKVLNAIKPYLVGKLAQANLLLDFNTFRGDSAAAKGKPYGDFEVGILHKIRALNYRGTSETEYLNLQAA